MKNILTLSFLLSMYALHAQDYRTAIYQSYLHEQMDTWKGVMKQMEEEYKQSSNPALLFDLFEAEYGYMAWLVSEKRKKEANEVLEKAQKHMDILTELKQDDARFYSLKGAFYIFQVVLEPRKAPSLGRLAMETNDKAYALDPEEPQVWLEKANNSYYRPPVFGGSKRKAVPMYERAVELFESAPARTRENWVYMNCLAGLAIAYENTRKYTEAGRVYRKILSLEPSFKWVKEELYPRFREKHPGK